jgi:hypothetical protein
MDTTPARLLERLRQRAGGGDIDISADVRRIALTPRRSKRRSNFVTE